MTGGDAIVRSVLAHGVDTVFGIPGAQTYGLFDAMQRAGTKLNVIAPRHEQTAGFMAFGYAKSTGKVGVYSVVPGPGVLNSSAALCTAYGASTPVVCLTGQVPSEFLGLGKGHLHELPDQLATLRSLTKWADRIDRPSQAPGLVREAFKQATGGRPQPVVLETPWDVFDLVEPVELVAPAQPEPAHRPDSDAVERAAHLLAAAENPMIMVGSGAFGATSQVRELAELLQAPVVSFRSGRGIVGADHHLSFTCAEGFERWSETDVLLGVGSRLELQWFRWPDQREGLQIIDIDIDPAQAARVEPAIPIVADAAESVQAILDALAGEAGRPSRRGEFETLKASKRHEIERIQPQVAFLDAIRDVLPRDGFFVEEVCQAGFASYYAFPVYEPRTFVTCGYQGTLGFGFLTALGVKAGNPDRAVVSITGDGGFMFGLADLATAVQHSLGVVTVVFANGAYGNVLRDQTRLYDGRVIGVELRNPDFVSLAQSFGARGARAETPNELRMELAAALESGEPTVIEVPVDPATEASPWEFLMPASRT